MVEHAVRFRVVGVPLRGDEIIRAHPGQLDHPRAVGLGKAVAQPVVQIEQRIDAGPHRLQFRVGTATVLVDADVRRRMGIKPLVAQFRTDDALLQLRQGDDIQIRLVEDALLDLEARGDQGPRFDIILPRRPKGGEVEHPPEALPLPAPRLHRPAEHLRVGLRIMHGKLRDEKLRRRRFLQAAQIDVFEIARVIPDLRFKNAHRQAGPVHGSLHGNGRALRRLRRAPGRTEGHNHRHTRAQPAHPAAGGRAGARDSDTCSMVSRSVHGRPLCWFGLSCSRGPPT
jgi:hypothetical protein